jgi:hypothetical protein
MSVSMDTGAVTVTGTPTAVEHGFTDPARLILRNHSTGVTAYLGASGVASGTGFPLEAGEAYEFPIRVADGQLYAVCAEGQTVDLRWLAVS